MWFADVSGHDPSSVSSHICQVIIGSSLVEITQAETLLPGRDPCGTLCIRRIVQFDAKPGTLLADAAANFRSVFADADGEDQRVRVILQRPVRGTVSSP